MTADMVNNPAFRIALGANGISIWNSELFGVSETSKLRAFLASAFAVNEVQDVELRRSSSYGRIGYASGLDSAQIWRKLSQVFRSSDVSSTANDREAARVDADLVYLDRAEERPIRVNRVGRVLCTWRVHRQGPDSLRISHPVLRNRRDIVFRLEEELAALPGVESYGASVVTGLVSIRFKGDTTAERIARALEKAWPRLLEGLDGPPSRKRLFAALGVTGLAYAGQYAVPALRPIAVAAVTLYSFPNVVNAAKQLRRGEVGLPTLYSTGLAFMLISGQPFTASLMALLMQIWPQLAHRKIVTSQRRLFAGARRQPSWARTVLSDGREREIDVTDLAKDELIVVRRGETVAVDGIVRSGLAAIAPDAPFGETRVEHRGPGDPVAAGAVILDGSLTIRVERVGEETTASFVASMLPHSPLPGLPSSLEAERIANRNVKPTLVAAALTLLAAPTLTPAQAIVRPDYATGPRLSAQLSALRGVADGFHRGILFRNPAALDRLAAVDAFVIDASAGIDRRRLRVARVETVKDVSPNLVVAYALTAYRGFQAEHGLALSAFAAKRGIAALRTASVDRVAGATRYRDPQRTIIEIATTDYLAASNVERPSRFHTTLARQSDTVNAPADRAAASDRTLAPLWVIRDGKVVGVISFSRTGKTVGEETLLALAEQNPSARIVYLSRSDDEPSQNLARGLGIDVTREGRGADSDRLVPPSSVALWIGDGSDLSARSALAASAISVSVAPLSRSREDVADILLPRKGLFGLVELIALGHAHAARSANDYRTVYSANLLGAGGALFANLTSLHTGLLSHAGTGVIYARHAIALGRLASAAERKRERFASLVLRKPANPRAEP
jgi:cation transport ATPase